MGSFSIRRFLPAVVVTLVALTVLLSGCDLLPIISYQGRLLNSSGVPVPDGNYNVRYNLYPSATGGTPVYTETKTIAVKNGLFNSEIGTDLKIPPETFAQQLYLQVTINGESLSPRQPLRGAPYAMSLLPGAVVQGSVVITRTYAGYADTGAAATIANTNSSAGGGHGLLAVNRAAPSGGDRSKVAAIQARAIGGSTSTSPNTGAYAGIFQSDNYRGIYAKGATNYFAGVFDSNIGIQIIGGGSCNGCTMAYAAKNDGSTTISPGDFVATVGVTVDPDLNQPLLLVRRATSADEVIIGVAAGALTREPVGDYHGVTTGGFEARGGPAATGEYLSVVVKGLAQVRVGGASSVAAGDRLVASNNGAAPTASLEGSVARALTAPDASGLVWAMVDGR